MIELLTKLFPFTVKENVDEPATALTGLVVLIAGTGLGVTEAIVKIDVLLKPPPGDGLLIVIVEEPGLKIIPGIIVALSWLLLKYVVVSTVPFH